MKLARAKNFLWSTLREFRNETNNMWEFHNELTLQKWTTHCDKNDRVENLLMINNYNNHPSVQVGRQWIVTAAHCVEAGGDGQFTVVAGSIHRIEFSVHQQGGFFVFHISVSHMAIMLQSYTFSFAHISVNIDWSHQTLFLLAFHICMYRREWSI